MMSAYHDRVTAPAAIVAASLAETKRTTRAQARRFSPMAPQTQSLLDRWRNDSVLDPAIPLGLPDSTRTMSGPTVFSYFRAKHARGEAGKYFLHQVRLASDRGQ